MPHWQRGAAQDSAGSRRQPRSRTQLYVIHHASARRQIDGADARVRQRGERLLHLGGPQHAAHYPRGRTVVLGDLKNVQRLLELDLKCVSHSAHKQRTASVQLLLHGPRHGFQRGLPLCAEPRGRRRQARVHARAENLEWPSAANGK